MLFSKSSESVGMSSGASLSSETSLSFASGCIGTGTESIASTGGEADWLSSCFVGLRGNPRLITVDR